MVLACRLAAALALLLLPATAGAWGQRLDDFARCLTESGAVFYGTYWCPQCTRQRDLFGRSDRYVRYVECATEGSDEPKRACKSAGVRSYPTWVFGDGSRVSGRQSLERLAARTGCALPD
jgi:glutaredoxin